MNFFRLFSAAALSTTVACLAFAQDSEALLTEVNSIEAQLVEIEETISKYDTGLIQSLAKARKETLLLSKALVQNRINSANGQATIEVTIPAVTPNEELAQKLLGELAAQQQVIDEAIKKAEGSGGLLQALALSRVETERLSLSQLQMAYLQAKYGIAFPSFSASGADATNDNQSSNSSITSEGQTSDEGAEPDSTSDTSSSQGSSNWVFVKNNDDFTDKDTSFVYLSASSAVGADDPESIVARCDGKGGYEIYVKTNGYIGARDDRVRVRYRFGSDKPISERWSESTSGTAAFLPDGYKDFRGKLALGRDFIFEVTDYNGSRSRSEFENNKDEKLDFVMSGCRNN